MNLFAASALFNAVASFSLAAFVFLRNRRSSVNRTFCLLSLAVALWSFGYLLWQLADTSTSALFWSRFLMMGAILLPPTYYHHILAALKLTTEKRPWLRTGYGLAIFFLILNQTPYFVESVGPKLTFRFWPVPGPTYFLFLFWFFGYVVHACYLMARALPSLTGVRRNQVRYMLIASIVGFAGGATNYPLWYDIPLMPWGNWLVGCYTAVLGYAIARHRLMDINVAIRRTTVFMMVYTLVLGLPLWGALAWETRLAQAMGPRWWVGLVIVYALLATAAHYANRYFQQKAEGRLMAGEHKAHEDLRFISQNMMRFLRESTLLKQIARSLVNTLHISHAAVYLTEGNDGRYQRKATWYHPPRKDVSLPETLPATSALGKDLATVRIPRVKEELKLHQEALSANWREMTRNMDAFQASVVIPAFHQRRFFGFLVLGDKRSGRIWTQDDLNLLMVLANQAALAIENARFHEAEEAKMVERERDQMALDISSAVSHQYSNRLQVIENLCWQSMTWLQEMLKKEAFDLVKLTRVLRTFESIRKECARGGEIAKGIMSLAKTIPAEFQPAEIPPMVRDAIEFVTFKHTRGKVVEEAEIPEIVNGLPPNLPKISCNSAQVHDSIMNVIDNAVDAVEERIRKMRLKVLPLPPEPYKGRVVVKAQAQNGKIVITVEDNGIGIKEEDKRKIFVPLFTTKGSSQGTGPGGHGLGLFYIKRILMAHGGRITVESEYGKGACFTIELPALKEDEASHAA